MSKINVPIAFLSLVTSVLLWASVYNSTNSKPEKKDVLAPLQPSNLDLHQFTIKEIPTDVMLSIAGKSDQLKTVAPYAIVDLSKAKEGTDHYPVVVFPSSVRDLLVSSSITVDVRIERIVTKSFEIKGVHTGAAPDGKRIDSLDIFPKRVFVTGPIDTLQKVATVQVFVDYSPGAISTEGVEVEAKALDNAGMPVPNLVLRTGDSHPEYTEDAIKEPATIRVHLKLEQDTTSKPTLKIP